MIRVSLSALPPAEMGTTMRTGLLGNWSPLETLDAASAVGAKGASAVIAEREAMRRRERRSS